MHSHPYNYATLRAKLRPTAAWVLAVWTVFLLLSFLQPCEAVAAAFLHGHATQTIASPTQDQGMAGCPRIMTTDHCPQFACPQFACPKFANLTQSLPRAATLNPSPDHGLAFVTAPETSGIPSPLSQYFFLARPSSPDAAPAIYLTTLRLRI